MLANLAGWPWWLCCTAVYTGWLAGNYSCLARLPGLLRWLAVLIGKLCCLVGYPGFLASYYGGLATLARRLS
jgi:hypothetical protein